MQVWTVPNSFPSAKRSSSFCSTPRMVNACAYRSRNALPTVTPRLELEIDKLSIAKYPEHYHHKDEAYVNRPAWNQWRAAKKIGQPHLALAQLNQLQKYD